MSELESIIGKDLLETAIQEYSEADIKAQSKMGNTEAISSEDEKEKIVPGLLAEGVVNDTQPTPDLTQVEEIAATIAVETSSSEAKKVEEKGGNSALKEQQIKNIFELKNEMTELISNIRDTQRVCVRYTHNNQYLQDYVGSLMASGEMGR